MTVVMKKQTGNGTYSVELIYDPGQMLGRCRGKGNYVVRKPDRKHYRVDSMLPAYRSYKEEGFKVTLIH